jgi:hypothetical protein
MKRLDDGPLLRHGWLYGKLLEFVDDAQCGLIAPGTVDLAFDFTGDHCSGPLLNFT